MSPEQAEGKPVDGRSDIFSFGALLYELVTRRRAFQADSSLAILTAILREDPKPASSVARGIPPELDRIVERCLRKDPERRFQSAADLKVTLEDLRGEIRQRKPSVEAGSPASPVALVSWTGSHSSGSRIGSVGHPFSQTPGPSDSSDNANNQLSRT